MKCMGWVLVFLTFIKFKKGSGCREVKTLNSKTASGLNPATLDDMAIRHARRICGTDLWTVSEHTRPHANALLGD
jgi:hypothetical protein